MALLSDLSSELIGWFPKLSPLLAVKLVNRGWRDVRKDRRWSFLRGEANLLAPLVVQAGTASTTQYNTSVVLDATATAAVQASGNIPPITERQFRVGGNQIYSIVAFNVVGSIGTITLDRLYAEGTATGQQFLIYKCYYQAPSPDFIRWVSFVDPVNDYRMRRRSMSWTKEMVDRRDPYRGAFDNPIVIAAYKWGMYTYGSTSYNVPVFELWPHPLAQIGYLTLFQREGMDLAPTEAFPAIIPDELVLSRSKYYAYQWAKLNAQEMNIKPSDQTIEMAMYKDLLNAAKLADENTMSQNYFEDEQDQVWSGPIDANYIQSHDMFLV